MRARLGNTRRSGSGQHTPQRAPATAAHKRGPLPSEDQPQARNEGACPYDPGSKRNGRFCEMTKLYGSQSMIAPLRSVLVKRPDNAFAVDDPVAWHYTGRPDLA